MNLSSVILKPILTEKSVALQAKGIWSFYVHPQANKNSIKEALKKYFEVNPIKVRTMQVKPKIKRIWQTGKRSSLGGAKKALVWLPEDEEIKEIKLESK